MAYKKNIDIENTPMLAEMASDRTRFNKLQERIPLRVLFFGPKIFKQSLAVFLHMDKRAKPVHIFSKLLFRAHHFQITTMQIQNQLIPKNFGALIFFSPFLLLINNSPLAWH